MPTRPLLERIDADWRRVRPGLDPTPMRRIILLARTAAQLARAVEQVQGHHGLNSAQADLLFTLYRSAPAEGLTPGDLAALSAITPASITNRLDTLTERGLISRETDPADARSRRVQLTAAGRDRVEALLPDHLRNEQRLLSTLSEPEQTELERLLLKLVVGMEGREES
ncbi:MarR family winged helix-turn-helix transcriptional regulator [Deinococcus navajonensis]|uniref:MarR family winged helix-turn-helix transcriptional regulator n=1 Tax=Deinococcus navajonensis TaxID=309884 RepID=A0ABV8XSK8_9DEIO